MATLLFAVPCVHLLTDSENSLPSYIYAVEQMGTPDLPVDFETFTIATQWFNYGTRDSKLHLRLIVTDPDGDVVTERNLDPSRLHPIKPDGRYRINIRTPLFKADKWGNYTFRVESRKGKKWAEVAALPVLVFDNTPDGEDEEE